MSKKQPSNIICRNKRAVHRFELLEKIECGVVLHGSEVKSLREGQASLEEAFARIENGELWLLGLHIGAYRHSPSQPHSPLRRRKLLVHGRELRKLRPKTEQKGLTLVPLDIHLNERGIVKVTLCVARGKRMHDKREDLRQRDQQREMDRAMNRRR